MSRVRVPYQPSLHAMLTHNEVVKTLSPQKGESCVELLHIQKRRRTHKGVANVP